MASSRVRGLLAASSFLVFATVSHAQTVKLDALDGSMSVQGELIEFDGKSFRIESAAGAMVIAANLVSCSGEGCPVVEAPGPDFTVSGAKTLMNSLIPTLVDGFAFSQDADVLMSTSENRELTFALSAASGEPIAAINLVANGSAEGLRDLLGEAALAVTSRPIRRGELNEMIEYGLGDLSSSSQENIIALEGLLVITAPSNPIRALSMSEIVGIFSGRLDNWSSLGGVDAPINLYVPTDDSGLGSGFSDLVMNPAGAILPDAVTVLGSDREISDAVANDPYGIGVTNSSQVRNAKALAIRGSCGIQTPATTFTIKTEEYPLTRRLYLYRPDKPISPVASEFASYVQSEDAQGFVSDAGLVGMGISSASVNEQGLRFASAVLPSDADFTFEQVQSMVKDLISADRLSVTFRFEGDSNRLDSRSQADITRFAEMLANSALTHREVLLIGYSDSLGETEANLSKSVARAEMVLERLLAEAPAGSLDGIPIRAMGYGELSPLACNDTIGGRAVNRRVEAWLRDIAR